MTLPTVTCPNCRSKMSLGAMIGCQAAGEALKATAELHPAVKRILWPAFLYVDLFSPAKQALRWDRISTLMQEVGEMVSSGRVERNGQSFPAPLDYWLTGMEEMLAKRDTLRLPLTSHGYLKTIVANLGNRAEAQAEKAREAASAGRTPVGLPPPPPPAPRPAPRVPASPRSDDDFKSLRDVMKGVVPPPPKPNPETPA